MPDATSIDAFEASRDLLELGIREQVGFLGPDDDKIFVVLHSPIGSCTGGVLICPPLYGESPGNYRREVLLARSLAAQGIAVLRFHYRGTGHSDGDVEDATFASFHQDAVTATEHLLSVLGNAPIAFFGTRLGGCVAAATATRLDRAPIALWQPMLNGRSYFQEIFRLQMMSDLTGGAEVAKSKQSYLQRLEEQGAIDLMGFPVTADLYESLISIEITDLLTKTAGPVLLVQIAPTGEIRKPYMSLIDGLRKSGRTAEVVLVPEEESWWFSYGPDPTLTRSETVTSLLDATTDWLIRTLPTEVAE